MNNTEQQETVDNEIKMPEPLLESLRVITGERPQSFKDEFQPNLDAYPYMQTGKKHQEVISKIEGKQKKAFALSNNKVHVFDITDSEQAHEYEQILDILGDPSTHNVYLSEPIKEPMILLDKDAPKGYRAIVYVSTMKPKERKKTKPSVTTTQPVKRK